MAPSSDQSVYALLQEFVEQTVREMMEELLDVCSPDQSSDIALAAIEDTVSFTEDLDDGRAPGCM